MALHFLQSADFRLDMPLPYDADRRMIKTRYLRGAVSSLVTYAKLKHVPLCLLPGDLIDAAHATAGGIRFLDEMLGSAPHCTFVIAPGNLDPWQAGGVWDRPLPPNVLVFRSRNVSRFRLKRLGVEIYGCACQGGMPNDDPLRGLRDSGDLDRVPDASDLSDFLPGEEDCGAENPKRPFRIFCCHGAMGTSERAPLRVTPDALQRMGFDYVALGHRQSGFQQMLEDGRMVGCSGCPEGLSFRPADQGVKTALEGQLDVTESGSLQVTLRQQRICKGIFYSISLDVGGCTQHQATEKLEQLLASGHYGPADALAVTLRGKVPLGFAPDLASMEKRLGRQKLFLLRLINHTLPLADAKSLTESETAEGAFYRAMLPWLEHQDPEVRSRSKDALQRGMYALQGGPVDEVGEMLPRQTQS